MPDVFHTIETSMNRLEHLHSGLFGWNIQTNNGIVDVRIRFLQNSNVDDILIIESAIPFEPYLSIQINEREYSICYYTSAYKEHYEEDYDY
jgi:hypothetical protein